MCNKLGYEVSVYDDGTQFLERLLFFKKHRSNKGRFHFRIRQRLIHLIKDIRLVRKLKQADLVILSECIPNAYWRGLFGIEELRKVVRKPICLYEVYYLGNSDTHTNLLKFNRHHDVNRYDWNFSVSAVTEKKGVPSLTLKWSVIGLDLHDTGLQPCKKEFIALLDFAQPGFEDERKMQLDALEELNIKTILLEGEYSMAEIREQYKAAAVLFIQFPEAFGMPIAECLSTGTNILLPDINWAMSWRKENESGEHYLPSCFTKYDSAVDLKEKLTRMRETFDSHQTPLQTNAVFMDHYGSFFNGDPASLETAVQHMLTAKDTSKKVHY